ncbi:MAG: efflux RND transporter periplasmic adaptor subunit [Synergistaceae bacterium]|nr:efflux RND transporter periplasmic adaptor subunit [Synergistaceae bacterium]
MKALKKTLYILFAAGIIAGGAWWFLRTEPARYVYRTQPVTVGSVTATIGATGKVNAVEMVEVGTQVSGTIKELYADYNSAVKKGQLIALLDPDVLQSRVEEARAALALAQAGVARAKATVTDSERAFKRAKELMGRDLIAKSELDAAETALLLARASLSESGARVVQARAGLKQAETNLGYTKILSPVDGVVISRQVDVGQTVAASLQTPTLFSIARDLTQMQIEASIDEADIGRIAEGQKAVCKFDAWPKLEFEGTVTQVRLAPEIVSNVVTYTVVLKVGNADMKLKPGMTANVTIITEKRDNVLKVASAALRFSPPSDAVPPEGKPGGAPRAASPLGFPRPMRGSRNFGGGGENTPVVWLVENGRLAGSLPAGEQGLSDRTWVEVLNSPLKEGQELAVSYAKEDSAPGATFAGTKP